MRGIYESPGLRPDPSSAPPPKTRGNIGHNDTVECGYAGAQESAEDWLVDAQERENKTLRKRVYDLERQLEKDMISMDLLKLMVFFMAAWLALYVIGLLME